MKKMFLCVLFMLVMVLNASALSINSDFIDHSAYKISHEYVSNGFLNSNWHAKLNHSLRWEKKEVKSIRISPVSEPSTFILLGVGLIGLSMVKRRIFKK